MPSERDIQDDREQAGRAIFLEEKKEAARAAFLKVRKVTSSDKAISRALQHELVMVEALEALSTVTSHLCRSLPLPAAPTNAVGYIDTVLGAARIRLDSLRQLALLIQLQRNPPTEPKPFCKPKAPRGHVCGIRGFDGMKGDVCQACRAAHADIDGPGGLSGTTNEPDPDEGDPCGDPVEKIERGER